MHFSSNLTLQTLHKILCNYGTNWTQIKMLQFWKYYSTVFFVLGAHGAQQQTQRTRVPKILKAQHWLKQVQTSVNLWICVLSFEASLLDNRWRYNIKRGSFGNLRVQYLFFLWAYDAQKQTQLTGVLQILSIQSWLKQVQTSEPFGVCVLSFEASLLKEQLVR